MKKSLMHFLLFIVCTIGADVAVSPTFIPRSQGRDKLRTLVGTLGWGHVEVCDLDCWYGNFSVGLGYTRSFRDHKVAECLFGSAIACGDCDTVLVQGKDVANRDEHAWLADYFYLNCEYDGSFQFKPRIQNVLVDLQFYLGLDKLVEGLYLRAYGPITWTKWTTGFCVSETSTLSTAACVEGYMTPSGSEVLLPSLSDYFCGQSPATTENVVFSPLKYAKMPNCCDETKTSFAELRIEIGWNPVQTEYSHFGFNAQLAVPTGNKRDAEYVFSPVVGNGRHWEAGGGLSAHYNFTMDEDSQRHSGIYTDLSITHLFRGNEDRVFDLCGKPVSRYMLAEKLGEPVMYNLTGSTLPDTSVALSNSVVCPNKQFKNEFCPVANLTHVIIRTKNTVQVDWVTFFNITRRGWSFDFGYNFWVRTCDDITDSRACDECEEKLSLFDSSQNDTWALKGDAQVFGYASATSGGLTEDQSVPLSATQNGATIKSGTNAPLLSSITNADLLNSGIDNPRFAYAGSNNQRLLATPGALNISANHIKTSIQPVFINEENIDRQPTRGLSHKIFAHIGYTWDRDRIIPFLGFGGFVEFGANSTHEVFSTNADVTFADACCGECIDCSLTQWALWLKGGFSFG